MTAGDREQLDALANRIMGPHLISQQQERERLRQREGRGRLLRVVGICMVLAVGMYLLLK